MRCCSRPEHGSRSRGEALEDTLLVEIGSDPILSSNDDHHQLRFSTLLAMRGFYSVVSCAWTSVEFAGVGTGSTPCAGLFRASSNRAVECQLNPNPELIPSSMKINNYRSAALN